MKPFAVAILNWNGVELLQKFLPKVVAHSTDLAKIYVIDNASDDDSVAFVKSEFADIEVIQHKANYGYAGGYNLAMPHISEEFVVLLNSDIETTENWLVPLHKAFLNNEKLAACQPKILDLKNKEKFEYAGAAGGFMDFLGYPFCRGRLFFDLENDEGQYDENAEIFWATGAALVVRKDHYTKAGGLDESLFAHMEEIDLCWRMQLHGFQILACPSSRVYHLGGATLAVQNPRKTFLNFRNNLIILAKNLPFAQALKVVFIRLVLDGIAGIKYIADGQPKHTWQIIKAHFAFYRRLPKMKKVRKQIPTKKPFTELQGVFNCSLLLQYFIKKKKNFSELPADKF